MTLVTDRRGELEKYAHALLSKSLRCNAISQGGTRKAVS